jgi:N4-gp56 family major capsid protein
MANAYTDTSGSSLGTSLVQTAYDRYVEFALRAVPLIRDVADKKPVQQAMPGSSVVFQIYTDLAQKTSVLSETVDPDAVALGNTTTVSVTLNEYGNASLATRKLELFSLSDVDPAIADIIAFNMADSLDTVALNSLVGGPNAIAEYNGNVVSTYAGSYTNGTTQAQVLSTDVIKSRDIRTAVAKLRANKAVPRQGEYYWCGIHPEVSFDLRAETGAGGWRDDHKYSETGAAEFWPGTIGTYEGAMFVESPRLFSALDGTGATGNTGTFGTSAYTYGTGGVRVFRTLVAGKQALAEAVAEEPHVIFGPVVDKLMRFRPIGWYGVLGWQRYRDASLVRIESTSSIHTGA